MSDEEEYFQTTRQVRKALYTAKNVYIATMMGNLGWSVKISKEQAVYLLREVDKKYGGNAKGLDSSGLGFIDEEGDLHLGGL
jgi:hypothetical protein